MPRHIIHLLLAWAAFLTLGCEAGVLSAAQTQYKIGGPDLAILKDAGGTLSVDALESPELAARFVPLNGPPQLGYAKDVVWLRLRLQRQEDAPPSWFLEYINPFINDLRLYTRSASGFTVQQAGDQFAFADRALKFPHPVFALEFPDTRAQTFYLRMDSDSSLSGELLVWQRAAMRDNVQEKLLYFGAVLGMILMTFLIAIIHWLHSRETKILQFAMLTVTSFLLVAIGQGLVAQFFVPTLPVIADLLVPWSLVFSSIATGVVFSNVLNIHADYPRLARYFKLTYVLVIAAPFTRYFDMYNVWGGPMLQLVSLTVLFSTTWVSCMRWRSNAQGAAYFFAAHVLLIASILMGRMTLLGWLPANTLTNWSWIPGLLTFLFLIHAGIFVDSQWVKHERDAALGEAQTAKEVLLSERKLRKEQTVFFSFVAHELRSPLAAILTGAKNLENELADVPQQVLARARRIKAYAEKLGGLIDRHLTLQRLANADFSPRFALADPRPIGEEGLRRARALFGGHQFSYACAEGLPASVFLDQDLLLMGLENLLMNAAKFSPDGAAVALEVFADAALHFRVSDRGPGIRPEQRARLFSIFNRMQQPEFQGGFGIGLAIVQRVADVCGGTVEYADRAGGGAVFTLSLPLSRTSGVPGSRA